MLETCERARCNTGTGFEVLGSNAGERGTVDAVACFLPRLACKAERHRLAGPGIADDDTQIATLHHMSKRCFLLGSQVQSGLR